MEDQIKQNLNSLDSAYCRLDAIRLTKQDMKDKILTPEMIQKMEDLDAEFEPAENLVAEEIQRLTDTIKMQVIKHGESVKGEFMQCSWVKGRTSWNSKGLEGYAVANPDVLRFKKVGNPSASIKKNK